MAVRGEGKTGKEMPVRQRKAHKKSRLGCFVCSFTEISPSSFQFAHQSAGPVFSVVDKSLGPINPGFRVPVIQPVKGGVGEIILDDAALAAIERFRLRTVFSVGTQKTRSVYSEGAFLLGLKHPFLMHVFIALALLHDQHLNPCQTSSHRTALAFHWYQATALFHRRLMAAGSAPDVSKLSGSERDSLWASGALLGAASMALLDAEDVYGVWPLKKSDSLDLDWLRMSDGKKVVWNIADPTRKDSIFHQLLKEWDGIPDGSRPIPPDALPAMFYDAFDIGPSSAAQNNPYHVAASLLAQLLPRRVDDNTEATGGERPQSYGVAGMVVYQSSRTQLMVDAEKISGGGAGSLYLSGDELWA
ncbi:Sterol regulatory element binding [Fusarium agapanthi]|uniref:Sterol regulatory element binding n=1 Tax=Fusarium agapanthi TaxID=1803897 RepID=A0A9P5E9B2_9HYPO|nr:Sterol regulatory element binding [Fusarium agapanthi]